MLIAYKVVEIIIFLVFAFFIADIRKKKGMKSLVSGKANLLMKLVFLIAAGGYLYMLVTINELIIIDVIGLVLTLAGMLITTKAKLDLAGSHTWAGYGTDGHELVTRGIYQYIRHPLYTGIFVFMAGGLAIIIPRLHWSLVILAVVIIVYFMISLIRRARLETRLLTDTFGEQFLEYKKQVHSFLPVRKYHQTP